MSGTPVAIGPFSGGINIYEDPQLIQDDQLVECINFDIGRAGELISRAGLKLVRGTDNPIISGISNLEIIGTVIKPNSVSRLYVKYPGFNSSWNILYSDNPEATVGNWYPSNFPTTQGDVRAVVYGVYDGAGSQQTFAWFVPYGYQVNSTDAAIAQVQNLENDTINSVNMTPRGSGGIVFKNRFFIWGAQADDKPNQYRVYYSAVGNFTSWPVNNFFDVNPGDGDPVTAVAIQGDALVIFKRNSTWSLFFETDPFLGTLRKVNNEIGASNGKSVITYQNEIYLISRRGVHRLVSLLFEDIGQNLGLYKIRKAHQGSDFIHVIGDKILCCIDTGIATEGRRFRYFVYHIESGGVWSEYLFSQSISQFTTYLDFQHSLHQFATEFGSPNLYHMHPVDVSENNFGDYPNNTTYHSVVTKRYDYGFLTGFKRLFWWAATVATNKPFTMSVITESNRTSVSKTTSAKSGLPLVVTKAFAPTRFRLIQYIIRSTAPNNYLRIYSGEANVTIKRDVDSGYPIEKA